MNSGIYGIFNLINGKVYVGKASNINSRFRSHKSLLNKGVHYNAYLQHSWNKYGKSNFKFDIIEYLM